MGGEGGGTSVEYAPINAVDGSLGSWSNTSSLNTGRLGGPGVVAHNGYLYAIGGYKSGYLASVEYAPINNDGTLGLWSSVSSLNARRANVSVSVYNDYIYAVGGGNGAYEYSSVEYANINADGSLGLWTYTTSLNTGRSATDVAVYNGYIYAIAGQNSTGGLRFLNSTEVSQINTDGTLGLWSYGSSLNTGRSYLGVGTYNGYLYAVGGGDTDPLASVEVAKIYSNAPPVANAGEDLTIILGETVTFDGSASDDPDGEIVSYDWDFDDGYGDSGETVDYTYDLAGEFIVTLTVTDDDGATAEDIITITVLSPEEATDQLITGIEEEFDLPRGIENSLTSKLDGVSDSLANEEDKGATNQLRAFIKQVKAQRGKKISEEDADALIEYAENIIDSI